MSELTRRDIIAIKFYIANRDYGGKNVINDKLQFTSEQRVRNRRLMAEYGYERTPAEMIESEARLQAMYDRGKELVEAGYEV